MIYFIALMWMEVLKHSNMVVVGEELYLVLMFWLREFFLFFVFFFVIGVDKESIM